MCTPEAEPVGAKAKKKSSFASVGDKFVKSLKGLMTELASSQANFVRCIKPNPELKPNKLHGVSVIDQLRMSGTLDAVRLIQAGYPSRIPYDDLSSRYRSMMPANVQNLSAQEFCELIAAVCDIGKEECAAPPSCSSTVPQKPSLSGLLSISRPSLQVRARRLADVLPAGKRRAARGPWRDGPRRGGENHQGEGQ